MDFQLMDNLNMTGRWFLWVLWFSPPMELYMLAKYGPGDMKLKHSFRCKYKGNETFCSYKIVVCQKGT
jgi:hypothetical protein